MFYINRIRKTTQPLKPLYALHILLCAALLLASCAEDGDAGPKGEPGAQGDQGTLGEPGDTGHGPLFQAGYFEGVISGTNDDNTAFTESFRMEYTDNKYTATYGDDGLELSRYEYPDYYGDYISLEFSLEEEEDELSVAPQYFYIYFERELDASSLFSFYAASAAETMAIINYEHDAATGILSFDFTYTDDGENNSTGRAVTITGSFNSGKKVYTEVLSRKRN